MAVHSGARPIVGVTASLDPGMRLRPGIDYAYLKRSYGRAIRAAGGMPVLLTPDAAPADVLASCHALVISGGDDLPARISPDGSIGEPTVKGSVPELAERVAFERELIDQFRAAQRPLLGVCYGMQLLNLHLGGTLHESFDSKTVDHGGAGRDCEHGVALHGSHPAFANLPDGSRVCSSHRQCLDRLAPGVEPLAEAPDGVIEAIGVGELLGVEWHPENDETAGAIYGWLVRRAAELR